MPPRKTAPIERRASTLKHLILLWPGGLMDIRDYVVDDLDTMIVELVSNTVVSLPEVPLVTEVVVFDQMEITRALAAAIGMNLRQKGARVRNNRTEVAAFGRPDQLDPRSVLNAMQDALVQAGASGAQCVVATSVRSSAMALMSLLLDRPQRLLGFRPGRGVALLTQTPPGSGNWTKASL